MRYNDDEVLEHRIECTHKATEMLNPGAESQRSTLKISYCEVYS